VVSILEKIVDSKGDKDIFIIGKGPSMDHIDFSKIQNSIIINLNDSELIVPGDICVFHDIWVEDYFKDHKPQCDLYFSDKELNHDIAQINCDFVPYDPENAQFLMSRFFSNKIYLEQALIISALRVADEIGRMTNTTKTVYLLGFDFTIKSGYTKKMSVSNRHISSDYDEHMVARQEHALIELLAQEHRLSVKINHIGRKSYSNYSVEEFNGLLLGIIRKDGGKTLIDGLGPDNLDRVKIVAEITTNHFGNMDKLFKMISLAKDAGADYVKLQKRDVESFYSNEKLNELYDSPFGDTFRDYRNGIELSRSEFVKVDEYCKQIGIDWFASVLDQSSYDFITDFSPDLIKLPSTISEHKVFLSHVADTFKKGVVISTGYTDDKYENFILEKFSSCSKLYLLQCTSAYPAPLEDAQIAVVRHYSELSNSDDRIIPGYSSHDIGSLCSMMSVAAGARMIEKHVKLGTVSWSHFDEVALDLHTDEFKNFVSDVRRAELINGDCVKKTHSSEHHKYWLFNEAADPLTSA
jgi:N-acetylneuraminate synthase